VLIYGVLLFYRCFYAKPLNKLTWRSSVPLYSSQREEIKIPMRCFNLVSFFLRLSLSFKREFRVQTQSKNILQGAYRVPFFSDLSAMDFSAETIASIVLAHSLARQLVQFGQWNFSRMPKRATRIE